MGEMQRVSIVDMVGGAIKSYGGSGGSRIDQFEHPINLAVDEHDNVLVADEYNNRVMLLSPSMTYLGCVTIPGYELHGPCTLHLDRQNNRLYISEYNTSSVPGRVFVLSV